MARPLTPNFISLTPNDYSDLQKAFKLITQICHGELIKDVYKSSGIKKSEFDHLIRYAAYQISLPSNKSDYPRYKDEILSNIALWYKSHRKIESLMNKTKLVDEEFLVHVIPLHGSTFWCNLLVDAQNGITDEYYESYLNEVQRFIDRPYMKMIRQNKGWSDDLALKYGFEFFGSEGLSLEQFMAQKPAS